VLVFSRFRHSAKRRDSHFDGDDLDHGDGLHAGGPFARNVLDGQTRFLRRFWAVRIDVDGRGRLNAEKSKEHTAKRFGLPGSFPGSRGRPRSSGLRRLQESNIDVSNTGRPDHDDDQRRIRQRDAFYSRHADGELALQRRPANSEGPSAPISGPSFLPDSRPRSPHSPLSRRACGNSSQVRAALQRRHRNHVARCPRALNATGSSFG
jgi:hypothetical protein